MSSGFAYCSHGEFLGRSYLHEAGWGGVRGKIIRTLPPDFNSRCAFHCFTQQSLQGHTENHWEIQLTLTALEVGRRCGGHQLVEGGGHVSSWWFYILHRAEPLLGTQQTPGKLRTLVELESLPQSAGRQGNSPDKEAGFCSVQVLISN